MVGSLVRFLFTCCEESQTNEWAQRTSEFAILHNKWIKIVQGNQPWSNLHFRFSLAVTKALTDTYGLNLLKTFSRLEMRPQHISSLFQELKVVRFRFVGSCQFNSCLIKSQFDSEFVGTDKPTKILHSFAEMRICESWIKTWTLW